MQVDSGRKHFINKIIENRARSFRSNAISNVELERSAREMSPRRAVSVLLLLDVLMRQYCQWLKE